MRVIKYSDFYLCKGNPYGSKKLMPDLHIANGGGEKTDQIFGIASLRPRSPATSVFACG